MQDRQIQTNMQDINSPEYIAANPEYFTTRLQEAMYKKAGSEPVCAIYNGKKVYKDNKKVYLTVKHPHIVISSPHVYRYRPDLNTDIEAKTYIAIASKQRRAATHFNNQLYRLDTTPPTRLVDEKTQKPILLNATDPRFTVNELGQRYFHDGKHEIPVIKATTYSHQQVKANKNKNQSDQEGRQKKRAKVTVNKMGLDFLTIPQVRSNETTQTEATKAASETISDKDLVQNFLKNPSTVLGNRYQHSVFSKPRSNPDQVTTLAPAALKR